MKYRFLLVISAIIALQNINGQNIVNSKHNLSSMGNAKLKSLDQTEICFFCHTPHSSNPSAPLWNRQDPGTGYTVYNSSTSQSTIGQPDGSSLLCLSCHDGTIALGKTFAKNNLTNSLSNTKIPKGSKANLGRDLSNDHPISFVYNTQIDEQIIYPPQHPVKLDKNSKLQCTSCHEPHNDMYGKFLVASKENSIICMKCHKRDYWENSSHATSMKTYNGAGGISPWRHIEKPYQTVKQNACENCHSTHNAQKHQQLLKDEKEEQNCLDCHNGNVATKNIQNELTKVHKHQVASYTNIHNAAEAGLVSNKHVECQDCHNPHATNSSKSVAPNISGSLAGVTGIDKNGNPVKAAQYEYEICFKCHSANAVTISEVTRQVSQSNLLLSFSEQNPSFHPVMGEGKNTNVPSLITPYNVSSKIYCTDCHSSNGNDAPKGPHGSIYQNILKAEYKMFDPATGNSESAVASNYALCFTCHNVNSILSDVSFKLHKKHIVEEKTACFVCHDSHGISSTQAGNQGGFPNNTHLINFNTKVVTSANGNLRFEDRGINTGKCYLTCHNKPHNGFSY